MITLRAPRSVPSILCLLLFLNLAAARPAQQPASPQQGRAKVGRFRAEVVKVESGDTVTVKDQYGKLHRVHQSHIDAPEQGQPYAEESRKNLESLALQKVVNVMYEPRSRAGMMIADLWIVEPATDSPIDSIATYQLVAGMAWYDAANYPAESKGPSAQKDKQSALDEGTETDLPEPLLPSIEALARKARAGLWAAPSPVPPWEFRKSSGGAHDAGPPLSFNIREPFIREYAIELLPGESFDVLSLELGNQPVTATTVSEFGETGGKRLIVESASATVFTTREENLRLALEDTAGAQMPFTLVREGRGGGERRHVASQTYPVAPQLKNRFSRIFISRPKKGRPVRAVVKVSGYTEMNW